MEKNTVIILLIAVFFRILPGQSAGDSAGFPPPASSFPKSTGSDEKDYTDSTGALHSRISPIFEDTAFDEEEPLEQEPGDTGMQGRPADTGAAAVLDSAGAAARADSLARAAVPERPAWLYPAINPEQDRMARQMLNHFYLFDWNSADKIAKKLQKMEKKQHLPPLSYLLMVGMRVLRVLNGEYERDRDRKELLHEIEKLSAKGLELADPEKSADSCKATNLFISGGIKGFLATLEIDRNPINAALNGFAAQKLLEKALARDSTIKDACLGLGLFNCVLAKAPLIVRGALSMIGKDATLENGIDFLRKSAYHGCYTNDIARLYLVQFLSPYLGHEAKEKMLILQSLQRQYPGNPYFVFLEIEENLCFHPAALASFSFKRRIKRQIAGFTSAGYSGKRYANLVKWQYLLVDPIPLEGIAPDTTFNLRGFSYYPVFLQAIGERTAYRPAGAGGGREHARRLRYIKARGTRAARMLDATPDMSSSQKGYYLWHIRDALRVDEDHGKK